MVLTTSDEQETKASGRIDPDDLLGALLVLVVEEGEEERHDHRVDAAPGEELGRRLDLVLGERHVDRRRPAA